MSLLERGAQLGSPVWSWEGLLSVQPRLPEPVRGCPESWAALPPQHLHPCPSQLEVWSAHSRYLPVSSIALALA